MNAKFSAYHSVSNRSSHTPRCEKRSNSYVISNALTKTGINPCINHATASSSTLMLLESGNSGNAFIIKFTIGSGVKN